MSGTVDTSRQAGDDEQILPAKIVGQAPREAARGCRSIARTDDRDRGFIQQVEIALGHDQRWRILKLGKETRIKSSPECQLSGAELFHFGDFALGIIAGPQDGGLTAAAPSELRNRRERGLWSSEPCDQLAIGDRPDARCAH